MKTNTIYNENCMDTVRRMPDGFLNCVVTSPPYYGLRDYGTDEQFGLEETPELFVQNLVTLFREICRALRDDGTVWLNLGDTYSSHKDCKSIGQTLAKGTNREDAHVIEMGKSHSRNTKMLKQAGLKNKDLIGIPWRVAFALQADGWYLRQDIIWHKPNPMPESVTDRCTKAHEYIFLLSKSAKYWYDADAVKENADYAPDRRLRSSTFNKVQKIGHAQSSAEYVETIGRNKRSVWTVTTKPYKEAHFATFPESLIKPCILAGCPKGGIVYDPFGGAGTTAVVSHNAGRNWILSELNPEYVTIATKRLHPLITQKELF